MCLYSRLTDTRLILEGDEVVVSRAKTHIGTEVTVLAPATREQGIEACCTKDNYQFRVYDMPRNFINKHGFVSDSSFAVFKEARINNRKFDEFHFDNGTKVCLKDMPLGVKARCTQTVKTAAGETKPQVQLEPTHQLEETLVPVGAGHGPEINYGHIGRIAGSLSVLALAVLFFY